MDKLNTITRNIILKLASFATQVVRAPGAFIQHLLRRVAAVWWSILWHPLLRFTSWATGLDHLNRKTGFRVRADVEKLLRADDRTSDYVVVRPWRSNIIPLIIISWVLLAILVSILSLLVWRNGWKVIEDEYPVADDGTRLKRSLQIESTRKNQFLGFNVTQEPTKRFDAPSYALKELGRESFETKFNKDELLNPVVNGKVDYTKRIVLSEDGRPTIVDLPQNEKDGSSASKGGTHGG